LALSAFVVVTLAGLAVLLVTTFATFAGRTTFNARLCPPGVPPADCETAGQAMAVAAPSLTVVLAAGVYVLWRDKRPGASVFESIAAHLNYMQFSFNRELTGRQF